jgi:hypothetical protein
MHVIFVLPLTRQGAPIAVKPSKPTLSLYGASLTMTVALAAKTLTVV